MLLFFFSSRRRHTSFLPVSWARSVYKRQVEDAASHIVKIVDTVEPDPDLVKKYDEKYQKFAKIYPALKDIYSEIV